jgi:DNA helicase-2/ATP-dependent DNA helicase PcrA
MQLLHEANRLASINDGALHWLDEMSVSAGDILARGDLIAPSQAPQFFASVQEMKGDMHRSRIDTANLRIDDLGLFASPERALKLSTLHFAKGRERVRRCRDDPAA